MSDSLLSSASLPFCLLLTIFVCEEVFISYDPTTDLGLRKLYSSLLRLIWFQNPRFIVGLIKVKQNEDKR